MTKYILIIAVVVVLFSGLRIYMRSDDKASSPKVSPPVSSLSPVRAVEKVEQRIFDHPPEELVILGIYSDSGVWYVKFPEGYGFLGEGDFWKSWRIKVLRRKGAVFVDKAGSEYLVRLRFDYPDEPVYDINSEGVPGSDIFRFDSAPRSGSDALANGVPSGLEWQK